MDQAFRKIACLVADRELPAPQQTEGPKGRPKGPEGGESSKGGGSSKGGEAPGRSDAGAASGSSQGDSGAALLLYTGGGAGVPGPGGGAAAFSPGEAGLGCEAAFLSEEEEQDPRGEEGHGNRLLMEIGRAHC